MKKVKEKSFIIKPPFPWFGGKSRAAHLVWPRLGDVPNYVEPFAGGLAVMLARPHNPRMETVNDLDGFICNFWRAVKGDPEGVAHWSDWPVNENDLHARHAWLTVRRRELTARLEGDPEYFDARIAGWWVWGICVWIGGGWCSGEGPWRSVDGRLKKDNSSGSNITRELPHLKGRGRGINRQGPTLSGEGRGVMRQRPTLGNMGQGIQRRRLAIHHFGKGVNRKEFNPGHYFEVLSRRLRRVRVCCGDWKRILGRTPTTENGITGVFLDPPYSHMERDKDLYSVEMAAPDGVRQWALENGDNPELRIALCGYEGEHEMPASWEVVGWSSGGGYGNRATRGNVNRHRERIWFSPACLEVGDGPLFS